MASERRSSFDLAAAVAGASTVVLPPGRHVLAAKLVVTRKVTIHGPGTIAGSGAGAVIEVAKGGALELEGVTITRTAKPGSVIVCHGKLTARRCKISGGRGGPSSNPGAGIVAIDSGRITVEDCDFSACHCALQVDDRGTGRLTANRAIGTTIGIAVVSRGTCTASRNHLERNLNAFFVGDDARVVIDGNTCQHSSWFSIALGGRSRAVVRNNSIADGQRDGISVRGRAVATIEGNRVAECRWSGISLVGGDAQVRGNTVERCTYQGIWITAKAKARITGNECSHSKLSGIAVGGRAAPEVASNRCHGNRLAGILALEHARPRCAKNTLEDNERAGIEILGRAVAITSGNQIRRNRTGIYVLEHARARFERDHVIENGVGIEIGARGRAELSRVVVEESDGIGILVWSAATLASCRIAANGGFGLRVESAARVVTRGCKIVENDGGGIQIANRARGTFDGDLVEANRGYGISIEGTATPAIRGAEVRANERSGIYVRGRAKPRLEHNRCERNGEEGIEYGDKAGGTARDNACTKNEGSGIRLVGGTNPTLADNVCADNDDRGIALDEDRFGVVPRPTLRGNTSKGNGEQDGIGTRLTLRAAQGKLRGKPKAALRPAFVPTFVDGDVQHASKLGGTPSLAKGEAWPTCGSCARPMPLFLQLDLDKLPAAVRGRFGRGLLQLFHCTNKNTACSDAPSSYVLRRIAKRGTRQVAPLRGGFPAHRIAGWREHAEVPRWLELPRPQRRSFAEAIASAGCSYHVGGDTIGSGPDVSPQLGDKLFGWPCWIHPSRSRGCAICKTRHELVFQIDSEHGVPWMWGDSGVAFILQCPKHPDELVFERQCF